MLASCAGLKPIEQEQLAAIKRVGVVSLLGNEMQIKHVGTTVFTNSHKYEQVEGWGLDRFAREVIQKELMNTSKFTYVELSEQLPSLRQRYFEKEHAERDPLPLNLVEEFNDDLRKIANTNSVDTLLIVVRAAVGDPFSDTNQYVFGYGLYHRSFFMYEKTGVYGIAFIVVKDVKSMETLCRRIVYSKKVIDNSNWSEELAQLSPEKKQFIEQTIKNQFSSSIKVSLKQLGLTN